MAYDFSKFAGASFRFVNADGSVTQDGMKALLELQRRTGATVGVLSSDIAASLTAHTSNTSNPHAVSKSQVGLANADNTADADKPVSTATAAALAAKASTAALAAHTADTGNPHAVTAAQAGADPTGTATAAVAAHVAAVNPHPQYLLASGAVAVGSLPSAVTAGVGARNFVTDANATTFNSVVAAGGANKLPVFSDGANWRIG